MSEEIRNWLVFITALIGSFIAINTFIKNLQQRKLENTHKMLDFLRRHISDSHIKKFVELFHANNPNVVPPYEFHLPDGRKDYVETMFSEGGCGNGEIHNMIEIFNLISPQLLNNQLNTELIWFEYGQIMTKLFEWTNYLEEHANISNSQSIKINNEEDRFFAYYFNRFMKKEQSNYLFKPSKYYTYLE